MAIPITAGAYVLSVNVNITECLPHRLASNMNHHLIENEPSYFLCWMFPHLASHSTQSFEFWWICKCRNHRLDYNNVAVFLHAKKLEAVRLGMAIYDSKNAISSEQRQDRYTCATRVCWWAASTMFSPLYQWHMLHTNFRTNTEMTKARLNWTKNEMPTAPYGDSV